MKTQVFKFTNRETAITNFSTEETSFLANIYPAKIEVKLDGIVFGNVETAYQAAKVASVSQREKMAKMTPEMAKKAVSSITTKDWEEKKYQVMYDLLWQKFHDNPKYGKLLVATGECELVKLNSAGDIYWGVCKVEDHYIGENNVGKILMDIREKLKNDPLFC